MATSGLAVHPIFLGHVDLSGYFASCSAVSGSLIGLLFVAITLRYEQIVGRDATPRNQGMAKGAFVALANALAVSLLAQLPPDSVGVPIVAVAAVAALSTVQTQLGLSGRRGMLSGVFLLGVGALVVQMVIGVLLAAHPHRAAAVESLADVLFFGLCVALVRCWLLMLPEQSTEKAARSPKAATER